jgi:ankyrin repeat protein
MKRSTIVIILIGIPLLLYTSYVGLIFSRGIEHQILAATTQDTYPLVPKQLAMAYLKYGPNPSQSRTKMGRPALSYASAGLGIVGNDDDVYKTTQILIERGANVNELNEGMTPLHEALLYGDIELIEILLSAGANPEAVITANNSAKGLNAFQFAKLLESKDTEKYKLITELLNKVGSDET